MRAKGQVIKPGKRQVTVLAREAWEAACSEVGEDLEHERQKVREFAQRQGMDYPILIAGLANKQKASEAFPVLDKVRAFPTTVFRDASGATKAVHTGFNGPATGSEHEALVQRFRELVEQMLDE